MRRMRRIKTRRGGVRQTRDDTRQSQSVVRGSIMKPTKQKVVDDIESVQKAILERIKQNPEMARRYLEKEEQKKINANIQYNEAIAVSRAGSEGGQFAPFVYEYSDFLSVLQEIDNRLHPTIRQDTTDAPTFNPEHTTH